MTATALSIAGLTLLPLSMWLLIHPGHVVDRAEALYRRWRR